ncbi:hypothetical protein C0992_001077 [Termitomyces sp. T32_za158]|nr:hypothetical protein C0992_001077 [Termitomyces sp. T32_za158]
MLPGVSRAGPSFILKPSVTEASPVIRQRRHVSRLTPFWKKKLEAKDIKRDAQGNIIVKKKEQGLGAFKPLSAVQLTNELFQSNQRKELDLPTFAPVQKMIGKATAFPVIKNDPARIYGLPKKMLLEVRRLQLVPDPPYIKNTKKLVDSSTPHEYDLRTQTYLQPAFSLETLRRLLAANHGKLANLTTHKKHSFERREIPLGTSLVDLIAIAEKEPPLAPVIFDTLMKELSVQTKNPVLFAVDDFQALYCRTAYRDPHFVPIRPYHLSVPRIIMEYASGKKSFAKGAFVGAITTSDTQYKLPLELKDALNLPHERFKSVYDKRSRPLMEYTTGLKALNVPEQLSLVEAASLYEVWKDDKALISSLHDEAFLSKYTESNGNPRDFVWKGLLATFDS